MIPRKLPRLGATWPAGNDLGLIRSQGARAGRLRLRGRLVAAEAREAERDENAKVASSYGLGNSPGGVSPELLSAQG
jgi:hypothetical protein